MKALESFHNIELTGVLVERPYLIPTHFLTYFVCLFSEGFSLLHCGISSKLIILFKSLCNVPNPISYKNVWMLIANFFFPFLFKERERERVQWFGPGEGGVLLWGNSSQCTRLKQRLFWPFQIPGHLANRENSVLCSFTVSSIRIPWVLVCVCVCFSVSHPLTYTHSVQCTFLSIWMPYKSHVLNTPAHNRSWWTLAPARSSTSLFSFYQQHFNEEGDAIPRSQRSHTR